MSTYEQMLNEAMYLLTRNEAAAIIAKYRDEVLRDAAAEIRAMPPHDGPSGHKIARTASEAADSIDPDIV